VILSARARQVSARNVPRILAACVIGRRTRPPRVLARTGVSAIGNAQATPPSGFPAPDLDWSPERGWRFPAGKKRMCGAGARRGQPDRPIGTSVSWGKGGMGLDQSGSLACSGARVGRAGSRDSALGPSDGEFARGRWKHPTTSAVSNICSRAIAISSMPSCCVSAQHVLGDRAFGRWLTYQLMRKPVVHDQPLYAPPSRARSSMSAYADRRRIGVLKGSFAADMQNDFGAKGGMSIAPESTSRESSGRSRRSRASSTRRAKPKSRLSI